MQMSANLLDKKPRRIAKVIAHSGLCSRRDAEQLIKTGRVTVNNEVIKECSTKTVEKDLILVDGEKLPKQEKPRLWKYYKPSGLITTHKDENRRPTVFNNMPSHLPRVISVGRLDLNSEGLLLLTNNGDLGRLLEHPSSGWIRRYRLRVHGRINKDMIKILKKGIKIKGIYYAPIIIDEIKENNDSSNSWLTAKIKEGKNRELRIIMQNFGLKVSRLIRTSYGPFQLGNLKNGNLEEISYKVIKEQLGKNINYL
ncbi:MAG: pseudouridine synthase [Alphaproteobacteria bacterium TMED87]|nr:pseudouridine synthase [Rhodospirillaceae bacterium]OUV07253.1 MAG: pseudouridine synthase [Alphaproteobacteria bacterium TMED87]